MNVLLVMVDDMDNEFVRYMPYLSGLPEGNWVRFANSYQSTPLCGPARANLLLGERFDATGVEQNGDCPDQMQANEADAIWKQLHDDGVETCMVGKYTNDFGLSEAIPAGLDKCFVKDSSGASADAYTSWDAQDYVTPGPASDLTNIADYSTDRYATETIEFLAAASEPWFCYVAFGAPHNPTTVAARHSATAVALEDPHGWQRIGTNAPAWMPTTAESTTNQGVSRTRRLNGARCMLAVDEALEDIIGEIDGNGQLDDTVIFFLNDNGVGWGRNGIAPNAPGQKRNARRWCLDASLMIRWPGVTSRIERRLVSVLDIAPTILAIFGTTPSNTMPGRDLTDLIDDTAASWRTSIHAGMASDGVESTLPAWWHVRSERWAYTEYDTDYNASFEASSLYDLNADPWELNNVASTETAKAAELSALLAEYIADPSLFPTR